ncbi:S8 family serine peptidase [Lysobacter sp. HDW10]|uniref:autotransporter serine protease n=1 Tax=Lysobacter sp. HDW10 TaxID=2714936 RepID=UPI00140A9488|nr:autotransporter serine protease [Lysobacter sp. HDW10]QIK81821.1 S8 family serine peptidase [Lysobacter sp. HDW10]
MKKRSMNVLAMAVTASLALGLTACGGGGGTKSSGGSGSPVGGTPSTPPPVLGSVQQDLSLKTLATPPTVVALLPASGTQPIYSEHLRLINADQSYANGLKGSGVTIGIMDSGVNSTHPTLNGRVMYSLFALDPADNNANVDYVKPHGTVVAELAAGAPSGQYGGGVAPLSNIASVRMIQDKDPVDDGSGQGNEITPADAAGMGNFLKEVHRLIADQGAKISNNSWGGLYWTDPAATPGIVSGFADFILNRDGIVVFANGNAGDIAALKANPSDMASLPSMSVDAAKLEKGWLTVAALDPAVPTQLTSWSQQCGRAMNYCLTAPGIVTYISADAQYYLRGGGTSYAAPLVSGAAAVVWSAFPYFNNDLVRQTLLGTAKDLGAPGVDPVFGYGLLDVGKAIKGPGQFNWGNVTVAPSNNSVWRNTITGTGGLIKNGAGTLTLTEAQGYTGGTTVNAGALDVRKGLNSKLTIASGGLVYAAGRFNGGVDNAGKFFSDQNAVVTVAGNYTQSASGNLGVWVGNTVSVTGSANINGQLSILGQKSGYTSKSRETVLNTLGGLTGTFATVKTASNVFLDATMSYDANNAYLNVTRLQVTALANDAQMSSAAINSAGRVEAAMTSIDVGAVDNTNFVLSAASLQHARDRGEAERSLQSLGGEIHASSAAMTFESLDIGRRTVTDRLDRLMQGDATSASWSHALQSNGNLISAGYSALGMDVTGNMSGFDMRWGRNGVLGAAYSSTETNSWLSAFGDRSRGRQGEAQIYAAWFGRSAFLQALAGAGRFDRQIERHLQLGALGETVTSQVHGTYTFAGVEGGVGVNVAGIRLTPYVGTQYANATTRDFDEGGLTGFALRSRGGDASRWQAYSGLRAAQSWTVGNGVRMGFELRSEWQQLLASQNTLNATFTALNAWMPVQGLGFAKHSALYSLGFNTEFGKGNVLKLDVSQRTSTLGTNTAAMLTYQRGF